MAPGDIKDADSGETSEGSTSSHSDESDASPIETLVAGRQKRATAANRYDKQQLINEVEDVGAETGEEDPMALLFLEDESEEDVEFDGSEADDADIEMDSSSDDDDKGPNEQGDALEGEKELLKQTRAEKQKKRRAELTLTTASGLRKKLKLDPTAQKTVAVAPKPNKKKARPLFPADVAGPSRGSLRATTVANKEQTKARLIEDEKERALLALKRQKRQLEKERDKPRERTQADRLAEAEKMERRNAKSLNRWEADEKKRAEEQAAKLAALRDRKLEGPVVTMWSGIAKWTGPKLIQSWSRDPIQDGVSEVKKRGRKPKAYHEQLAAAQQTDAGQSLAITTGGQTSISTTSEPLARPAEETSRPDTPMENTVPQLTFTTPRGLNDFFLEGIHEFASMHTEPRPNAAAPLTDAGADADQHREQITDPEAEAISNPTSANFTGPLPASNTSTETPSHTAHLPPNQVSAPFPGPVPDESLPPFMFTPDRQVGKPLEPPAPPPPVIEDMTKNLVVLDNFDDLSLRDREEYGVFYSTRKAARPVKHVHELCPITALPARYRDPSTGVAYANAYAYRKIQELKQQEHAWSSMLGCYVGRANLVARGVPQGFLG